MPKATASNREWIAPVDLPPPHIGVLQGIFTASWHGLQRDLQHARGSKNPEEALREASVFARLLAGLERGEVSGPDEAACKTLRELMIAADVTNDHARIAAEHDALQGLLDQLGSSEIKKQWFAVRSMPAKGLVGDATQEGRAIIKTDGPEHRNLERAVLAVILREHPVELTFLELAGQLFESVDEPGAGSPLACAVRDLAVGGLLKCRGPLVLPTRAALHVKYLELRYDGLTHNASMSP